MSNIESHADWLLAQLATTGLTVYDGKVDTDPPGKYVLVRSNRQLPTGEVAPDKVPFTGASAVVDMRFYIYSVGRTEASARAIAGQVEAVLLDVTPAIAGRVCWPIRWTDGSPTSLDEQTLQAAHELVDIYQMQTKASA